MNSDPTLGVDNNDAESADAGYGVLLIMITILIIAIIILLVVGIYQYQNYTQYYPQCQTGECPISLQTGQKFCDRTYYYPQFESCSVQYSCTATQLPNAVMLDGSTVANGPCPEGYACPCSRTSSCGHYVTASFQYSEDSYIQVSTTDSLCAIPMIEIFNMSTGGCPAEEWSSPAEELVAVNQCMTSNPCLRGQLAYIADPSTFNINDLNIYPVGCVYGNSGLDYWGNPLSSNSVFIWDQGWGGVVQKQL